MIMKQWFDQISIQPSPVLLSHPLGLLTLGSCFADEIGQRLLNRKFNVCCNPAGVIYNPISLEALIHYACGQIVWDKESALETSEGFFSWDHHGKIRGESLEQLGEKVNHTHAQIFTAIKESSWLILTLGTAYVFEKRADGMVVANCHKKPSDLFLRRMLSLEECLDSLNRIYQAVKAINPEIVTLLTVSPVRHLRDGHELNQVSKSTLRLAVHQFVEDHNDVLYFPAYELALDELRDYRFYKSDFMHLTQEATDYIFNRFEKWSMSEETIAINRMIEKIKQAIDHRPLSGAAGNAHIAHLTRTRDKINQLMKEAPHLDFEIELKHLTLALGE